MAQEKKGKLKSAAFGRLMIYAGFLPALVMVLVGYTSSPSVSKDKKMSATEIQAAYQKSFNYEKKQDYENAISAIDPVFDDYRDGYTVNLRLGWLYYMNKNYDDAIEFYLAAIDIAPDSIEAKLGYTLPLLAKQKYGDAASVLGNVTKIDAYNYTGNLRLAYVLRLQKKHDAAVKICNKMLALYPTDVSFLTELALDKYAKGEKNDASDIMWNVLVLDPDNATAKSYFQK